MKTSPLLFALLIFLSLPAAAVRIADVEVPTQVTLEGVDGPLQLNGAGIRYKFFFKIYVAALYLPRTQSDAAALLADPPANRVLMHFVYDEVSKAKMDDAWKEGFADNLEAAEFAALQPRLEQFIALFGDMHAGDEVWLDYVPGSGTRVTIDGRVRGTVPGADFNRALLSVWLGREPVSSSLRDSLLGL